MSEIGGVNKNPEKLENSKFRMKWTKRLSDTCNLLWRVQQIKQPCQIQQFLSLSDSTYIIKFVLIILTILVINYFLFKKNKTWVSQDSISGHLRKVYRIYVSDKRASQKFSDLAKSRYNTCNWETCPNAGYKSSNLVKTVSCCHEIIIKNKFGADNNDFFSR